MDDRGSGVPNKLPGVPSGVLGHPDIHQTQDGLDDLCPVGQCGSSNIHRQEGRSLVPFSVTAGQ